MPELPEVQTTVNGLNRTVKGKRIVDIRTSYNSSYHAGKDNINNPKFFALFKRKVKGQKILKAKRRAKNVLIQLSGEHTIIVHMKMTGHFVYDRPNYPFTRLDLKLDNGKHLALSDMRKFTKVTLVKTAELEQSLHLGHLGPEPLHKSFQFPQFKTRLLKQPRGRIKQVLMDQNVISGIGNIYSDEILWYADVHPLSHPDRIPDKNLRAMFKATKKLLQKGISLGGDSMSDYRNIKGEKGRFQNYHHSYRKTGSKCDKRNCRGIIKRIVVGARSAHFCPIHQVLYK